MISRRPSLSGDLLPSERRLVAAMQRFEFGRFERLKIQNGEAVLTPWPLTIRGIKFGGEIARADRTTASEFTLGHQVVELLEYIRGVKSGDIRILTFRHGEPFSIEIETVEMRGSDGEFEAGGVQCAVHLSR